MIEPIGSATSTQGLPEPIDWNQVASDFDYAESAALFESLMKADGTVDVAGLPPQQQGEIFYFSLTRDMILDGIRQTARFSDALKDVYER